MSNKQSLNKMIQKVNEAGDKTMAYLAMGKLELEDPNSMLSRAKDALLVSSSNPGNIEGVLNFLESSESWPVLEGDSSSRESSSDSNDFNPDAFEPFLDSPIEPHKSNRASLTGRDKKKFEKRMTTIKTCLSKKNIKRVKKKTSPG